MKAAISGYGGAPPINDTTTWIATPCTAKNPKVAIAKHLHGGGRVNKSGTSKGKQKQAAGPKSKRKRTPATPADELNAPVLSRHQQAERLLAQQEHEEGEKQVQETLPTAFEEELLKGKTSIVKRIRSAYFLVQNHMSFNSFETLIDLQNDNGAFHDCPKGKSAGSAESDRDGYDSSRSVREFVRALALATREFWLPKIKASGRGAVALDETGDHAHRTQLAIMYKIAVKVKGRLLPVIIFAGTEDIPRGTADVIVASIIYRMKRDGIDPRGWLAITVADTCSVMHGCKTGVMVRLLEHCSTGLLQKCLSHLKALGFKDAADSPGAAYVGNT